MSRLLVLSIVALLGVVTCSVSAQAQGFLGGCYGNFGGNGFGGLTGYGINILPYSMGQVPVPPYFALHPPVYYSMPVPRTYGYSPYAYPGTVQTPEIVAPTPEMIENPHVKPEAESKPTNHTVDASQVILNPYVKQQIAIR